MKKILSLLVLVLAMLGTRAQDGQIEMADSFRADGKIYVVVAIIMVILVGFLLYLFGLDRRLKKIEKNYEDKN